MSRGVVLVADDDPAVQGLFREFLERLGYDVTVAATVISVLEIVKAAHIDAVVLDRNMPGGASSDALIAAVRANASVIVVTGATDDEIDTKLLAEGAFVVLQKPVDLRRLAELVDEAVALSQRRRRS